MANNNLHENTISSFDLNSKDSLSLSIETPGFFTTIQDTGRSGFQQFGMPVAGAMDQESYALGQALVGNEILSGALECTILPPTLTVHTPCIIAFTGADMQPTINDIPVPLYIPLYCKEGDRISGSYAIYGARMYIAFRGGIQVPLINGSVSTHTKASIGGLQGRALQKGDTLSLTREICAPADVLPLVLEKEIHKVSNPTFHNTSPQKVIIRVILGPQDDAFTDAGLHTLVTSPYIITPASDRMGFRLQGEPITHKDSADIISDGAVFGSIQVPADGQPIILMADRQTTGGYTKIATVITPDLPILSQLPIGTTFHFSICSIAEGREIYKNHHTAWQQKLALAKKQRDYIFVIQ